MVQILKSLEPRRVEKGDFFFKEGEELTEVLFFGRGDVVVGFEINKKQVNVF